MSSTLPRSLCGHGIVNAGIGGTSAESKLEDVLARALAGKRAAMVVVALGTNDAALGYSVERYRANYRALLTSLGARYARVYKGGGAAHAASQDSPLGKAATPAPASPTAA